MSEKPTVSAAGSAPMAGEAAAIPPRAEADAPKTAFIFVFVLASVFVLIGVVVAVDQFFNISVLEEIQRKVLGVENPALRQLHAEEDSKLTRYQWVDQKGSVVRIPLDRAQELVLAEWAARPTGFLPGSPDPTAVAPAAPATTPAPAVAQPAATEAPKAADGDKK